MDLEDENEEIFNLLPTFRELNDDEEDEGDAEFNDAQLASFKDSFNKIDKANTGTILISEIGSLLRAVGMNPSLKTIKEITDWFDMNEIERINCNQFIKLLKKTWKEIDPTELRNAIEVFDPIGNGYFTIEQFKNTLLNLGESLEEDDFKEILKTITVQPDGTINTEDIIQLLSTDFR
ncbi:unnamed protein product [Brachionus calyciflorus]|uniref:EF-hand domain-containing protein n=1 Tax=Brachionus calyciflorus TaxID=104777 RepID=A0A813M2L2_9BILA|nr:unnamed protein product [Brachionus calyciflorus]